MFSAPISGERMWEMFDPPPERAIGRDRKDISICQYILFTVSNKVTQAYTKTSYKNSCSIRLETQGDGGQLTLNENLSFGGEVSDDKFA